MNIAMIHFRVGETDGVSLEMDKWRQVLERNGHNVVYIAGTSGTSEAIIIEELDYRGDEDALINKASYDHDHPMSVEQLHIRIESVGARIADKLAKILVEREIDLMIPNNVLSLGRSPQIAVGLTRAVLQTNVKVLGHHHDFYWERAYFNNPRLQYGRELLDEYYPPRAIPTMKHAVINCLAQDDLLEKKGLSSTVVPNVFEFNRPLWVEDDYNATYRRDMGIDGDYLVFLQATRVTNRKAIELAVDLMAMLDTPTYRNQLIGKTLYSGRPFTQSTEIVLLMVGMHEGMDGYEQKLIDYARDRGVHLIVKPALIDHSRKMSNGQKVYSLWDAYVHCDMITYPSIYEGWGNQFLEGVFAKRPQIVFEYSVFKSDIKAFGFDYITLGDQYTVKPDGMAAVSDAALHTAAEQTIHYLTHPDIYQQCVEHNFHLGQQELSLEALERIIMPLVEEMES